MLSLMIGRCKSSTKLAILILSIPALLTAEESKHEERLITEDVILRNIDGNQLAGLFEKFSGKKVTVSEEAAAAQFTFVQKACKEKSMTFQEAERLVRISAILENFAFTADSDHPQLELLCALQPKRSGCIEEIKVYDKKTPLPNDNSVINYVMELRHVETKKALELLESKRDKSKTYAAIVAVPNSTAILIVDRVSIVRQLIEMQSEFDQPSSNPKTGPMPGKKVDQ